MPIHSYHDYLLFLKQSSRPTLFRKIMLASFLCFLIVLGISSALLYSTFRQNSAKSQSQYLDVTLGGFTSTKQSLDELLTVFKVAGAKVEAIDSTKEATPSAFAFFASVDDIVKTLSKIGLARENIAFQRSLLAEKSPPQEYSNLVRSLGDYT